jgi:hypothetical protein
MSMQDTASSGVALWRLVADGIERGIADGRFAAGEKLPGETEIAETYRVNRHTGRRALATLAERGLAGFTVILTALFAWSLVLMRNVPQHDDPPLRWMLWGGAASALVTTVVIGFVNTTLHHEHGLLAMLLLGCWIGAERIRRARAAQPVIAVVPPAATAATYDRPSIGD